MSIDLLTIVRHHIAVAKSIEPNIRYSKISADNYEFHVACAQYLLLLFGQLAPSESTHREEG